MKFTRLFILMISIGYCISSCKKDKEPVKINLDSNDVRLWAGQDTSIAVSGASGQYTVSSENEDIARAVVEDGEIHITTDLPGKTVIHVDDGAGHKADIKLNAITFSGGWGRVEGHTIFKASVLIESGDPVFAEELRTQILETSREESRTGYGLGFQTREKNDFIEMLRGEIIRQGTFTFRHFLLTLVHNNVEEVYKVEPINLQMVMVEQDLTAHYKALHPGKGITKVVVIRPMRLATFPG